MEILGDLASNDVVQMLSDWGLYSIYHSFFGKAQGEESRPTLFHMRKADKPYHVDYAFASADLFDPAIDSVEVGVAASWLDLSDHMPIIFSVQV